ncbi:MAG: hypothetical protein ACI9KE_003210 [Polyangiales bacterium]|jgi:hypothetical protein
MALIYFTLAGWPVGGASAQHEPWTHDDLAPAEGEPEPDSDSEEEDPGALEGDAVVEGDAVIEGVEGGAVVEGGAEGLEAAPPTDDRLIVVVVDAAAYGVDPVVGQHVSQQMRQTAAALGYAVVTQEDTIAAARRVEMPYPPTPSDLWRVTFAASSQRGAFARVWADAGRYVLELSVASADGTGPFFARGTAGAEDLRAVVDALLREALPTPDTYDAEAATAIASSTPQVRPAPNGMARPMIRPLTRPTRRPVIRRPRQSTRPSRRFDVALQTEAAFGASEDRFYNHLVGARFGIRVTRTMSLQLNASYINLRGRGERVHNILPMLFFENRFRISSRIDLTVPLRVGVGYLPFNGPVLRLAAGLNLPVSSRVEIGIDLLTPTFWFLLDQTLVSLNIGAEVIYRL